MEKRHKLLDEVIVAAPCPISWDSMNGDNRVRLCSGCSRSVYNISDMTSSEAEKFLANNGSIHCMQIYRRPDGKIMTDNCPRALRDLRNKCRFIMRLVSGIAASILAFVPFARNSAGAQDAGLRGEAYIPPDKQSDNLVQSGKPGGGAGDKGSCKKKILLGPDECPGEKSKQSLPTKTVDSGPAPLMSPGLVAFPVNMEKSTQQLPLSNTGEAKPDLRDAKALKLYMSAKQNESEGKAILAQTQYLEALKAAAAQVTGDPKFQLMIQASCNKLRLTLGMPAVDLKGNELSR